MIFVERRQRIGTVLLDVESVSSYRTRRCAIVWNCVIGVISSVPCVRNVQRVVVVYTPTLLTYSGLSFLSFNVFLDHINDRQIISPQHQSVLHSHSVPALRDHLQDILIRYFVLDMASVIKAHLLYPKIQGHPCCLELPLSSSFCRKAM